MPYFYLISALVFSAAGTISTSFYNRKNIGRKGTVPMYNLVIIVTVFLFWLVLFLTDLSYDLAVLPYSLLFSLCYVLATIGTIKALGTGSIMLTSLISQLSLIGASVWGFFFWDEQFTALTAIGLVFTVISLWLCLYTGRGKDRVKFNPAWIGYVILLFVSNAGCTITQRTQQLNFGAKYGNFMMLVAIGVAAIAFVIMYLLSDKQDSRVILRASWHFPVLAGIFNGLVNLFVILMATTDLSTSLIYPVIAVGSLSIITLASLLIFKERMRWWQGCGVALGAIATAILSI